jgi:hypothetical protein
LPENEEIPAPLPCGFLIRIYKFYENWSTETFGKKESKKWLFVTPDLQFLLYPCPFRDIVIANYATGADAGYNSQPAQKESAMSNSAAIQRVQKIKEPRNLSERITWLRSYYFKGASRAWNNEFTVWTTGTPWDVQFDEMTFYIVPETYAFLQPFRTSMQQSARGHEGRAGGDEMVPRSWLRQLGGHKRPPHSRI